MSLTLLLVASGCAKKEAHDVAGVESSPSEQVADETRLNEPTDSETPAETRIIGAWILDADATIARLMAHDRDMNAEFIRESGLGMIFGDDGRFRMIAFSDVKRQTTYGTYAILDVQADVVTVALTQMPGVKDGEQTEQVHVTFISADIVSFAPVQGPGETVEMVQRGTVILKRTTEGALQ